MSQAILVVVVGAGLMTFTSCILLTMGLVWGRRSPYGRRRLLALLLGESSLCALGALFALTQGLAPSGRQQSLSWVFWIFIVVSVVAWVGLMRELAPGLFSYLWQSLWRR